MPDHLKRQTFLEKARQQGKTVIAIEVPGYNETKNEFYRSRCKDYIFRPLREKLEFLKIVSRDSESRIKEAYEKVEKFTDLVFLYVPMPDLAHHLLFRSLKERIELYKIYNDLGRMIEPLLKKAYRNNYVVLIISDHGFDIKKYYHSSYGFWSLNKDLNWRPKTILNFHSKILELIETP